MKLVLFLLIYSLGSFSFADDLEHRRVIQVAMLAAVQQPEKFKYPFVSTIDSVSERGFFSRSSGYTFLGVNNVVSSYYDSSVRYDISEFYKSKNSRFRFIGNYFVKGYDSFLSWGYDTGAVAEKIEISSSFFLGASKFFTNSKNDRFISLSIGSWFGESVGESPCVDAYNRKYWCPNLTAWEDRPGMNFKQQAFIDFRFIYLF